MAFLFSIVVSLLSIFSLSNAHNIQLRAHSRECFHENLHKDDRMTVTFQVGDREFGGSGNLDIDFWVCCMRITSRGWRNKARSGRPCADGSASQPDTNAQQRLPDPRANRQRRRPLLRSERGWPVHLLLQQRELVSQHERGQLQCTRHCLRARE